MAKSGNKENQPRCRPGSFKRAARRKDLVEVETAAGSALSQAAPKGTEKKK